jgi:hypothetical protein
MSLLPDNWVERMLLLCEKGSGVVPGACFVKGQLLTSRKSGRRATVAFSDPQWTILDFTASKSVRMTTEAVNQNYQAL